MQKKILEFANILRKSGIRVSTAEALDAFGALEELSIEDRGIFKNALRSTMVKRGEEIPTYDQLFDLFWSGFYDNLREAFGESAEGLADMGMDLEDLLRRIAEALGSLEGEFGDLSELARALLTADLSLMEQLIREAAEQAGVERIENFLQVGFFSRRMLEQMNFEGAVDQLREFAARLEAAGLSPEEAEALRDLIERLMQAARRSVRAFTERELQKQNHDYMEKFRRETLLEKSFYHLTEEDGGIPFEVIFKQRKKDRPKLVILCDVSSSVANVSRFMMQFVYTLQEAFTKIRSFVFVAELGEVTQLFQESDINQSIEKALDGGDTINVYTRSNFGYAFDYFWKNYLSAVDNKTTVLILGDGRNNYNDPRAWCLRDIHNKAKNVVWLNPESPSAWGFGDSVMNRYLPYIDIAEECRNLRQLSAMIDRLVL